VEELSSRVLEGVAEPEEAIVLMHGWPGVTAEALPQLIESLREAGAELVDVPALGQRTVPR
jgi:peptidoglycan/xylan/chitin deacetylase (PgdA/CDA1 family)